MPVGSYRFKDHKYPGDIDLCEVITEKGPLKEAKKKITDRIITGIRRILIHQPKIFIADFKAGEDARFKDIKISIDMNNNDKNIIKKKLKNLQKNVNISKKLFEILDNKLTKESVSEFNDIIHNYLIIRWDISDLLNRKTNKNGRVVKLEDALTCKSTVKFDIWYNDMNKYIEVTNYLIILHSHANNKTYLTTEMGNLVETLLYDVNKYNRESNILKCLKRIWSLLNNMKCLTKNKNLKTKLKEKIELISPIFKDEPAKISQIKADLEVILQMAEKFSKSIDNNPEIKIIPADILLYSLLGIKNKLLNMRINDIDSAFIFTNYYRNTSNTILLSEYGYYADKKSKTEKGYYWKEKKLKDFLNSIIKNVPNIIDIINKTVNKQSKEWLTNNNIILYKLINSLELWSKEFTN